ncbi:MAG: Tetratricopeptide repeat protein [Euryarchaeota archaeon]|nr:Tetratricopeptide repeat protein [Euryarchaeota archaeon]
MHALYHIVNENLIFSGNFFIPMRGIYAIFILMLVLVAPTQCQQTANSGTISGFDLDNSTEYNKALNTALDFYNQCKYDEAIHAYDAAIRLDPNSTQTWHAWNGKGDALYGLGRYDEAILAYDKAIGLWPDNAIPWAYKGDALKALNRTNESEGAYARAKEKGFGGSTWRPKAITLNGRPIAAPETTITTSINEGLELYNQGKYVEAIQAYDAAIRLDPYNADIWQAWNGKADALKALGSEESELAKTAATRMHSLINPTSGSPSATPVTHILDHSMASKVDEVNHIPITRNYKFSTADRKAYSWISLANVGPGRVEWYWYSPDGNLYKTGFADIPPSPNGDYWPSYNTWYYINITNIPVEPYLSGDWHVNVYLVGSTYVTQLTEQFTLENSYGDQIVSTRILDHSTARNIDESTRSPITRTDKFYLRADSKIYSWISLANAGPSAFYWYWYSPDGSSYRVGPIDIPPNPSGGYWPSYNIWCSIDTRTLYGDTWDLELPSDEFHVDVTRNDRQILTEYFTVDE